MRVDLLAFAVLSLGLSSVGCGRKAPNATPEGAVRELVERVRRTGSDSTSAKIAFDLLAKSTQANLNARAERYSAASGKHIAPEAMIAPASFIERFEAHELRAEIVGTHARVVAVGLLPGEHAEIPCVFEDGGWRVQIELPPLQAVQQHPRDVQTTKKSAEGN